MSFVSFSVAFLAYGMVVRFMGKEGFAARLGQVILVPACIVLYDLITMASPDGYRYLVGSAPLLLCAGIAIYYRFFGSEPLGEARKSPSELAALRQEPKKFSKKSARIHAARKKRGRE